MIKKQGFTLMELMLAIGILVIVGGLGLYYANPAQMFANARNSQRKSHLNVIMNAIKENIADNRAGTFSCEIGQLPTSTPKRMAVGMGNYDIAPCLVPMYASNLPFDPNLAGAHYVSMIDYDTGYMVSRNASTSEVIVSAPGAELGQVISFSR